MIVVDTNVVAYLWIPGDHTPIVERLVQRDSQWAVPLLWKSEFRSILTGYVRLGRMTLDTAIQIVEEAESFLRDREYAIPSAKVLALALKSSCSAYDIEFVVLAQDLKIPLVTTDKKIIKEFSQTAVSASDFLKRKGA